MSGKYPFKISRKTEFQSSSLVVAWNEDVGKLGTKVADYLNQKLGGREFGEIDPVDFFPLDGVQVEDDLAQFPESKFLAEATDLKKQSRKELETMYNRDQEKINQENTKIQSLKTTK